MTASGRRGGRAPGVPNKRTLELTASVLDAAGIAPKDVMLQAMRLHWAAGNIPYAVECAARVAPYVHPRLIAAAVAVRMHPRLIAAAVAVRLPSEMSDDELTASAEDAEQAAEALALRGDLPSGTDETRH